MFISGKVQGVGFRFHAFEVADKLKLTGWVRNLSDGRVEILMSGEEKEVESMIKWAKKGPAKAEVTGLDIKDEKNEIPEEPFYIRREGS